MKDNANNKIYITLLLLVAFLPASILMPSAILNLWLIIICLIFIFQIIKKKEYKFLNCNFFYILLLFWFSLIINLLFSSNFENSISRSLGFGKFIILIFAIKYVFSFDHFKYESIIYKIWSIIFCIVTFDLIFEYTFGFNTLGFKSPWERRLSGFLNQELKIGHYYFAFSLFAVNFFYNKFQNKNYTYLIFTIIVITSFLIGERSNFIRMFFISSIFLILFTNKNFLKKIIIFIIIISTVVIFSFKNEKFKNAYYYNAIQPIISEGLFQFIKNSPYGSHYETALKIFNNYPIFGVGLKNFRLESSKNIYETELKYSYQRATTHPHQIHLEFLSETGIFGYLSFLIFIIYSLKLSMHSYFKTKNRFLLASILFTISIIIPLIPSGSFFTSYGAAIFWTNYAIMITYQGNLKLS